MKIENYNIVNVKFDTEESEGRWVYFTMEVIVNNEYKFTCKSHRHFTPFYSEEVYGNINNYYQAAFEDWKQFSEENIYMEDEFEELILDELDVDSFDDIDLDSYRIR